eukprot:CAMPEP_0206233358 /NCGR_PEP_ID=MMETSP0047_2-20121206/11941_1 /ASSEMBLY_ACC=CAM_ASM_000192 /TAXON_ID=195065 /ORGANISM="Chroomonas mesostigmatica_cf, Strain CCMP1168" /LENGTH=299 /DNA_ID=CAMNT_0053657225 /DNA_START=84 /DNA_END=983 /DNA_ORIENTATION=+
MTDAMPNMLTERLKTLTTQKRRSFCMMEDSDELLSSLSTPDKRSRSCSFDAAFCAIPFLPAGISCMSPVPIGSEGSSREASPDMATTTNTVLHGVPNALKGRLPKSIPMQALVVAMAELPQGARHTLATSLMSWRAGRMSEGQVVAFLRSVAWQSPALRAALGEDRTKAVQPEQELLTAADLSELLLSAPSSPQRSFSTFTLRPVARLGASPPQSPALPPQIPPCVPEEGDCEEAARIVADDALLDSIKTERLRAMLQRSPELQRAFTANGWDAANGRFEGLPDWGRALGDLKELSHAR